MVQHILRLRILAFLGGLCLVVAIFKAPRPEGLLDGVVWPFAYTAASAACMILAFKPCRIFLHLWASLMISIQLIRAVLLFINPTLPSLRWSSLTVNLFFAILVYFVWAGWKDRLPADGKGGRQVISLPVEAVMALATSPDHSEATLKERIEDYERVSGPLAGSESPTEEQQDRVEQYRLPSVPGMR
jgi:hypothetical protein